MMVPIKVETLDSSKTQSIRGLIDMGCTDSCVDEKWVKEENFELQKLDVPRRAHNADGTPNITGDITHYVELRMTIGPHTNKQRFFVSNLGKAKMFIGYDWIRNHNPIIDWRKHKIVFSRCPPECNSGPKTIWESIKSRESIEEGESILLVDFEPTMKLRAKYTQAQGFAEEANCTKEKMTEEKIPSQYRDYVKVFAKESFDALPEKRAWDHAIELKPDAKVVDCKIYPLSLGEQAELDKLLEENLKSGRIRSSKSPMASAFFFIKKKDGSLHPIQDYRKLNEMTIKN
jgi:hypothetical protein